MSSSPALWHPLPTAYLLLTGLLLAVAAGCASSLTNDVESKMNAPLRRAVAAQHDAPAPRPLKVFIACAGPPEGAQVELLEADGLRIATIVGRLVTAEGTPEALRRAARHAFVTRMELSHERPAR